ncbi:nucleoside triphosphate pyrophosphohydrolase [Methylovirgula sp. HY1]|uniref:nucleoside triphosphate pyrophosphohydrolase n=1 Tax=Methylovirgula sp. HY1 TaxID=2822761 RepID=UPI001C5B1823|nr:nucleoside triphosphate pyrophosphohydrolase [Methylovirgula sp. HY1]QXX73910.1 Nucleoside triphosphate pyrophosphohydrolase [Methylovirgula sp. HY1]
MENSRDITRLLEIMAALRTPGTGCPWDLQQDFASIAPYTIEEAYEVADAINRDDLLDLKDELGDLLLQVVYHARLAEEKQAFDFGAVVEAINAKMIRRHPHVFGASEERSSTAIKARWSEIKAQEKVARRAARGEVADQPNAAGLLSDVPLALPGLTRAVKLQSKASTVGFDWNDPRAVLAKIREETDEIEAALATNDAVGAREEIGDLLFAVANLARHLDGDPETAIRQTNAKFERRFGFIEAELARRGIALGDADLAAMDALWNAAKLQERKSEPDQ